MALRLKYIFLKDFLHLYMQDTEYTCKPNLHKTKHAQQFLATSKLLHITKKIDVTNSTQTRKTDKLKATYTSCRQSS